MIEFVLLAKISAISCLLVPSGVVISLFCFLSFMMLCDGYYSEYYPSPSEDYPKTK